MRRCTVCQKVEAMGADMVTVVGDENGGATRAADIGTMVLVPLVVDAVNVPVIGGGISDGRGIAAVLSLGAEAVIMGTQLLSPKKHRFMTILKPRFSMRQNWTPCWSCGP
ncbi:MAG: nitronate monooxygenase [Desulfobacterales bacterium]